MADYKYLKENNLFEAHMRFRRALGESFGYQPIEEADDDQDQQQDAMGGGMPPAPGAPGGDPMAGGGMPQGPDANGGMPDPNMGGDPNAAPGADPMGGGAPQDPNGQDPMAGGGMPPMPDDMGGMDEEEPKEDENVIDVDDMTKAQEKTNDKVNSVGKDLGRVDTKIQKLLGAIETLQGMFDQNNQAISDLKAEFEKRNPTQTEKLNLRSLDSYPFSERPTDFWDKKSQLSNYSVYSDNQEPTTHEYVITNNDVDDFSEREIADTFAMDDSLSQDIKKIFGL